MTRIALTARHCETKATSKQIVLRDATVRGLALRISPGGTRSWYATYSRPADGARLKLSLGTYPTMNLQAARKAALDIRAQVKAGIDPGAQKPEPVNTMTMGDLVSTYLARHASTKRSSKEIARRLNKNVAAVIGSIKLADLRRRDLTRCIDLVVDRGAGIEANRTFQDLRACVRWAVARGDLDRNLMEGQKLPFEAKQRERVLSAEEIRTMWAALAEAPMAEGSRNVIRLCLVTAQRVGEVAGMRLDELDLDDRTWTIPLSRLKNGTRKDAKPHIVPLSDFALRIIREQIAAVAALAERQGYAVPPFVFPGPRGEALAGAGLPHAIQRGTKGKQRKTLGIDHFTPHDLRRTASTLMEAGGTNPFLIAHILNHVSTTRGSVTSIYARHGYAEEMRSALCTWAQRLEEIIAHEG